ncbi:hypothetical protein ACGFNU_37260 [Spirillospora sp. NPDC048911]|uniref:hypothetical protein n=1 Tax=Spirillospora sp. NPDC048911 TaxID=3364527 RepID=UPI003712627F
MAMGADKPSPLAAALRAWVGQRSSAMLIPALAAQLVPLEFTEFLDQGLVQIADLTATSAREAAPVMRALAMTGDRPSGTDWTGDLNAELDARLDETLEATVGGHAVLLARERNWPLVTSKPWIYEPYVGEINLWDLQ